MVFGIIGMVNFAHGDVFMVSAFIALILFLLLTQVLGVFSIGLALLMVVARLVSAGIALLVLAYVWQALITAFSAVMTAVSYYYLRVDKEGVAIDEIAAVFD